ncbi:MAG: 4Fe-4S dicluster domain-containing protein [Anaerovoracaceae bacterium]
MRKQKAIIEQKYCVACGSCLKVCPKASIHIIGGSHAQINRDTCVGCGKCKKECPASVITLEEAVG